MGTVKRTVLVVAVVVVAVWVSWLDDRYPEVGIFRALTAAAVVMVWLQLRNIRSLHDVLWGFLRVLEARLNAHEQILRDHTDQVDALAVKQHNHTQHHNGGRFNR